MLLDTMYAARKPGGLACVGLSSAWPASKPGSTQDRAAGVAAASCLGAVRSILLAGCLLCTEPRAMLAALPPDTSGTWAITETNPTPNPNLKPKPKPNPSSSQPYP